MTWQQNVQKKNLKTERRSFQAALGAPLSALIYDHTPYKPTHTPRYLFAYLAPGG